MSTDRFVCRMLDNLAPPNLHPLHGPYLPSRFQAAARYARCSVTANAVRTAWRRAVAQGIPPSRWGEAIVWRNLLPEHAPVSHSACAAAARKALEQSNSDWLVECSIFHITAHPVPAEEWSNQAWDDPWHSGCDSRSLHLLSPELPGAAHQSHEDQALYGDAGYSPQFGATFCSQARGFGVAGEYWTTSSWASRTLSGRLPARYGWEPSTIHTAELQALVCSLRFRVPDRWHLLVFDRSSFGHAMRASVSGSLHQLLASSCCTLVLHLKKELQHLGHHWTGHAACPSWRQHQESFPQHWNSSTAIDGRRVVTSRIAFEHQGIVGLDIKSHQTGPPAPFPILVQGNEVQDQGCEAARGLPLPSNIRVPSGGPFAWYSDQGHMVTSPIREHVRNKLRQESAAAWCQRAVQGLLPRLITEVFRPALDPSLYTQCVFPANWLRWALPTDRKPHDLSAMAFRCQRAIGGSWTERIHAHEDVAALALQWSQHRQWPSARTCPLCRSGPGTPRHVVMACEALSPLVDMLRDDLEVELQQVRPLDTLVAAAQQWRARVEHSLIPPVGPAAAARWPVLSAWRWLIPLPHRESLLSTDVQGSSAIPTARERGWDLGYKGVLPKSLGATLCSLSTHELDALVQSECELYASLRQPGAMQAELQQFSKRRTAALPAIRVVRCLLLGLRRIRFEFQTRLTAWLSLCREALPTPPPEEAAVQAGAPPRDALQAWFTTGSGLRSVQELRWAPPGLPWQGCKLPIPAAGSARTVFSPSCSKMVVLSCRTRPRTGAPLPLHGKLPL